MGQVNAEKTAKQYAAIKTRIFFADLFVTVAALFVFQLFFSSFVSELSSACFKNFYLSCIMYVSIFFVFIYLAGVVLNFYGSFVVEHRFGLSTQTVKAWATDEIKGGVLSFIVSMAGCLAFYAILRTCGDVWWAVVSAVWIFFSVGLAKIFPVVVIPLFFKYSPIHDEKLKQSIIDLGCKADIKVMDVCQIDLSKKTRKANAALVGLGNTRKVILADTLLQEFTVNEAIAVTAHEFGHFKYRHILQHLILSSVMTFASFFLLSITMNSIVTFTEAAGPSDLKIFPVFIFLMMLFGFAVMPFQNYFSRVLERQADSFAIETTQSKEDLASVMRKLGKMNLAETDPPLWKKIFFYDHPPIGERIKFAENYELKK